MEEEEFDIDELEKELSELDVGQSGKYAFLFVTFVLLFLFSSVEEYFTIYLILFTQYLRL